jgi:hypothetical protein
LAALTLWVTQHRDWIKGYKLKSSAPIREASDEVKLMVGDNAIRVSVSDSVINPWLVYQLRDIKAHFTEYHGHIDQAHLKPFMSRSSLVRSDQIPFLLTDTKGAGAGEVVWRQDNLQLVRGDFSSANVVDFKIRAPNGRETVDGRPFFWLNNEVAEIILRAESRKIRVVIEAAVGPSVNSPADFRPKVAIGADQSQFLSFTAGESKQYTFSVPLALPETRLSFRTTYTGGLIPNKNGDPRTLLVGIKIIKVEVDNE